MDKDKMIKIGLIGVGAYILLKMTQGGGTVITQPSSGGSGNWLSGLIDLTKDIINKTGGSGTSMSKYSVRGIQIPACGNSDIMTKVASISDQNSQTMANPTLMRSNSLISGYANQADAANCKATGSALRAAASSMVK